MSNPSKSSRWGSFLTQAVAGVEARLDTILADEEQEKQRAGSAPATTIEKPATPPLRSSTPHKSTNDRLQERLARAVAAKHASAQRSESSSARPSAEITSPQPSSDVTTSEPLTQSPVPPSNPRLSAESLLSVASATPASVDKNTTLPSEPAPITNAQQASTDSLRSSLQSERPVVHDETSRTGELRSRSGVSVPEALSESSNLYEQRITDLEKTLEETQAQQQEELHSHIERVDALQAKLQYLAREASQAARNAAASAPTGSLDKKLAEKDEQIAQLMEEGQKLASTEQKHRAIIKKLRAQLTIGEKEANEQKIRRQKAENEISELRRQSHDIEELEKADEESRKIANQLKRDLDILQSEATSKEATISDLKNQLQEESQRAKSMAAKVNDQVRESAQQRIKDLEDAVAALELEKGLVADRAKLQAVELREQSDRASERSRAVELELKGEVQILESKLEALRARAEEASSGAVGDAQAKFLRQIETLQTQYSIASENWQGMEASLAARVANLEKERDEALRRESEMRRKARETASRAKRQEEELEEAKNQLPKVQKDLSAYQSQLENLRKRAEEAEAALVEATADFERQRATWKEDKSEGIDQDRRNWLEDVPTMAFRNNIGRPESPLLSAPPRTYSGDFLGLQSYPSRLRKASAPSSNGEPSPGERPASARRPSAQPPMRSPMFSVAPERRGTPPSLAGTFEALASPSHHPLEREDVIEGIERSASPQNVLHDMVSVSTMTAGPSVQLVERMSAAIRRLESEKVAAKEELARISSQRDEARGEIVTLMKEVEAGKAASEKIECFEKELVEVNERYQTTLEMLGEKSELVEELRADVQDVKAMYRDLVERTIK